jgi:hypothetical protein
VYARRADDQVQLLCWFPGEATGFRAAMLRRGTFCVLAIRDPPLLDLCWRRARSEMGQEDQFPRPRLNGRCRFRKRSLLLPNRRCRLLGQALQAPKPTPTPSSSTRMSRPRKNNSRVSEGSMQGCGRRSRRGGSGNAGPAGKEVASTKSAARSLRARFVRSPASL